MPPSVTGPLPLPKNDGPEAAVVRLRILCTTDVHMRLTGFNYTTDRAGQNAGFAGLGTLIGKARRQAKAEGRACVLLDNGDTLQGTPLGEYLAKQPVTADHAAVRSLNALGYDAIGVGNHDLDFGLPYLEDIARHLDAPVIASTLTHHDCPDLHATALVHCAVPGQDMPVTLGIISALPKLTEVWNHYWLQDRARVARAADLLPALITQLRARGADLVVVMAHMGITADAGPDQETATDLARAVQPDVIITGHTHRRFPGAEHLDADQINNAAATLYGIPAVMAGHNGSDLGILDLDLCRTAQNGWRIEDHRVSLAPNTDKTPPLPAVLQATRSAHDRLRRHLSKPIGRTDRTFHNFFSLAAPTATAALMARAKMRQIASRLKGTADGELPLLSSTAAHTAGGREGSDHYITIPPGPVLRRHLAALNPYHNHTVALRITGAELRIWLEHSAGVYATLGRSDCPQTLAAPNTPTFLFETVFGVRYTIDPTQEPGHRIHELTYDQRPITDDQRFILATNQFRAAGGGGYGPFDPAQITARFPVDMEDILRKTLDEGAVDPSPGSWLTQRPWRFDIDGGATVELLTSPQAADFIDEISHLRPQIAGMSPEGFLRLHLTL